MADEKTFSHITVSTDDEDDLVIQAGRRRGTSTPQASAHQSAAVVAPVDSSVLEQGGTSKSRVSEEQALDEARSKFEEAVPTRKDGSYRETQLDDLKSAPMTTPQKVVIVVAALLVVGFIVYYYFLR